MLSKSTFLALTFGSLVLCSSVFSQDGLPRFHTMQKALGGADTIAAIRDFEQEVRAESNSVRISDGNITHQLDITVDAASSLPVKIRSITLSDPAHPITSDQVTTEWETVQGIRFPRRWTVFRKDVRVAEAKDARSIVNSGLKLADLAAQPPDLKPVFSRR